jgi:hypothetical protein
VTVKVSIMRVCWCTWTFAYTPVPHKDPRGHGTPPSVVVVARPYSTAHTYSSRSETNGLILRSSTIEMELFYCKICPCASRSNATHLSSDCFPLGGARGVVLVYCVSAAWACKMGRYTWSFPVASHRSPERRAPAPYNLLACTCAYLGMVINIDT